MEELIQPKPNVDEKDVLHFIGKKHEEGLNDAQIHEQLLAKYGKLEFGFCSSLDRQMGTGQSGSCWRRAYEYPNVGSILTPPWSEYTYIVISAGFFTFNMEINEPTRFPNS